MIAPKLNQPDLGDFPPHLVKDIEFVWAETIDRVIREALEPEPGQKPKAKPKPARSKTLRSAPPARPRGRSTRPGQGPEQPPAPVDPSVGA